MASVKKLTCDLEGKYKKSYSLRSKCAFSLVTTLGIMFRGVIKKNLIHEVLQFPSTSFQILNCYMIVHYEYLLPMWVAMSL